MAREFNIKALTSTESIEDLHFTVTTTFQDLLEDFTYTELLESESLFVLLSDANIVAEDENGDTISGSIITSLERQKLEGIEASATADQTDAEVETAYNNQVPVVSQPDAEAGTSTTVKRWTPLRIAQAIAALAASVGDSEQAICPFGAKSDSIGKFLIANGKSTDADDSTKPKTRWPIPIDGTIVGIAYKTKDGSTTTQMKLHIDGVVEETIVLSSMNGNSGGREDFTGPTVSAADNYAEIEWDAGQKPGECIMCLIIQPS